MFDTYSDFIFTGIALKEGEMTYFGLSLGFLLVSILVKLILTAFGIFRGLVFRHDRHDCMAIVSGFDYVSVIDISDDDMHSAWYNVLTASWKTVSEDIP
jgi:hypothetical protein